MMKTILLTLTYLVGAGELVLAGYFWVTNSKSEVRRVLAVLAFSTGMWVIASVASAYTNPSSFVTLVLSFCYVFGAILITALLHFTIVYPYKLFSFDRIHVLLLYVPAAIFSIIALTTKAIVTGIKVDPSIPGLVISGPLHHIYNLFILLLFIVSILILVYRIRKTDGSHRTNIIYLVIAIILGSALPIWFDLLVPNYFPSFMHANYLLGNISTVIWLGTMWYLIKK